MSKALLIVTRAISNYLIKKVGFTQKTAKTSAVTLIQRFGGALNLNIHFHMLFLDGVYEINSVGAIGQFHEIKAPTVYDGTGFWLCTKRFSQGKLNYWLKSCDECICATTMASILNQGSHLKLSKEPHSHPHQHEELTHSHPYYLDVHHRHTHKK
jgi:hypothetical protein